MLNKDPDNKKSRNVFKPLISVIEPGTELMFKSVNKGHNTESIKGMIPDGVEKWKSKPSKDFALTIEKPGFYGYKCTPHVATGMVGLIICKSDGVMDNLAAAQKVKQKGKAKKVWDAIWEQAEADGFLA